MTTRRVTAATVVMALLAGAGEAQEARRRWELQRQIRLDKFEQVLPVAMKNAGLDAWIVAVKENHYDPLWEDLGRGYVTGIGYYAFFLRGDRVERLALGPSGYLLNQSGAYDRYGPADDLAKEVRSRDPKRIGVNMSEEIGPADGLSVTMHAAAEEDARRAVCLASRQRRAAGLRVPVAARGRRDRRLRRGRRDRHPAGRAGAVQRGDHAGEDHARRGGVVAPGPAAGARPRLGVRHAVGLRHRARGHRRDLDRRIVQPGDVIMIDWGVQLMNFGTDVKRVAYVLKPGETQPPQSIRNAFTRAIAARDVIKPAIKAGRTGTETMAAMDAALKAAGYGVIEFNKPNADDKTDITYGFHPVGNTGHDIGPSLTTWQPLQSTFTLHLQHLFSFEYFAYTPIPEWGGKKLRIPIEDDAMLMEHGIQFVHSANYRLLVIK